MKTYMVRMVNSNVNTTAAGVIEPSTSYTPIERIVASSRTEAEQIAAAKYPSIEIDVTGDKLGRRHGLPIGPVSR